MALGSEYDRMRVHQIGDAIPTRFSVEASVSKPQVAFKETLTRPADREMTYAKQTGGRGPDGHVKIHLTLVSPGLATSS